MIALIPLRRRLALWLCPELAADSDQKGVIQNDPLDARAWPGKVIPTWWHVTELREFLTRSHRKIRLVDAHAEALRRFGEGVPSLSAIHRYWQRLDALCDARIPTISPSQEPL